jgi:hypothetical protein
MDSGQRAADLKVVVSAKCQELFLFPVSLLESREAGRALEELKTPSFIFYLQLPIIRR